MCTVPDAVYELFERQFGRAARRQLADRHLSGDAVDELVRRRVFVPVLRGVYRIRGGGTPPEAEAMTAALRVPCRERHGPMVAGPLVLGLFDVDGYSVRDPFTLLVPPGRRLRRPAFDVRRDARLDVGRTAWGPLPVATVTRALVEEAGRLAQVDGHGRAHATAERRVRVGIHSAMWRRTTSHDELVACAHRLGPRHPGAAIVLDWAERGRLRAGSRPESDLVELLREMGLDVRLQVQCTPVDRVDVLVPLVRLVIEFDGRIDHDEAQRRKDRERDERLREADYTVLRVRAADLRDRQALRRRIIATVRACAAALGVVSPV